MPKIDMSTELGLRIKELRLKSKVKAKDLAVFINKSPAYISKLENGEIKQIEDSIFRNIINFITKDENGYEDFMERISEDISPDELEESILFFNFDRIHRKIPVPEELFELISNKMTKLDISASKLIEYVNMNEDLDEVFFLENSINKSDCEENVWIPYKEVNDGESYTSMFILLNYSPELLTDLLTKKIDKSDYTFIYAIIYHLLKYENKLQQDKQPTQKLKEETEEILHSYKFYTIAQRRSFSEISKSIEEYDRLLSDFDKNNMNLVNQLLQPIKLISDYDVKYANSKLLNIVNNMEIDPSFSLSFMALPIKELKSVNASIKREFLREVEQLIEIYKDKKEPEMVVEKY